MIAFLIGAGVGLVAGAGLGAIVMGLLANARVREADERADRYLGELDALTESTRPADDTPDLSDVLAGRISRPGFDANPTVLLAPGQTYEQWYEAYAETLDGWAPGWWEDIHSSAAPQLLALAEERRRRAETWARQGLRAAAEMTEMEAEAVRRRWSATGTGEHRPGMAIYPPKEGK